MREFNITGICNPEWHYMVDTSEKMNQMVELIEKRKYFTINRPRQYGKSTSLTLLKRRLEDQYLVLRMSMESVGQESYKNAQTFSQCLYRLLSHRLKLDRKTSLLQPLEALKKIESFDELSQFITDFVESSDKEVILMMDEVDEGTHNEVFLKFLGVLRDKYNERNADGVPTFQAVILAGVHDVKNLHLNVTGREAFRQNSPWNIATNFTVDLSFNVREIRSLLKDYLSEHPAVNMELDFIAERIHYFTSGYPFLVSYMCDLIERDFEGSDKWNEHHLEQAVNKILDSDNTNFQSLIKNLEVHKDLYHLVEQIVLVGRDFRYASDAPAIQKGRLYGMLAPSERGMCKIHNPIYEMRIYNFLTERLQTEIPYASPDDHMASIYWQADGSLNMTLAFEKYSTYLQSLYDDGQDAFIEKNARLLLGIFMKTIINGTGFFLWESQIANRLRPDITITYNRFKYLIELKIWGGEQYFNRSIEQLQGYLMRENLDTGYLVCHDFRKEGHKRFTDEVIEKNGKTIHAYFV